MLLAHRHRASTVESVPHATTRAHPHRATSRATIRPSRVVSPPGQCVHQQIAHRQTNKTMPCDQTQCQAPCLNLCLCPAPAKTANLWSGDNEHDRTPALAPCPQRASNATGETSLLKPCLPYSVSACLLHYSSLQSAISWAQYPCPTSWPIVPVHQTYVM